MSLYANYVMELTGDEILETDKGFATYRYVDNDEAVYILDIYVVPEFRKSGECFEMADAIVKEAKERGCKKLIGSVIPTNRHSTESIKVLLAYGLRVDSCTNNFILFKKDL